MAERMHRYLPDKVEALRRQLPLQTYLALLHAGAVSGEVPCLDPVTLKAIDKKATPLSGKTRMEALYYLVDKIMPSVAPKDLEHLSKDPDTLTQFDMAALTDEQLRAIASRQRTNAQEFSPISEIPVPDGESPVSRELASRAIS
jgi:hypothetical protein